MPDTVVIIGAGQAGLQSAVSLRQGGFDGGIVLVGDEPHAPYQRPPLSKKFLAGEIDAERLHLRPNAFFRDADITLELGATAVALNPAEKVVSFDDGGARAYDTAILATGTRSRRIPIPGADLEGVLTLRRIADVELFRPYLAGGNKVAIIGGGYIGLEVAAVVRALGLNATVLEAEDRVMQRVVSKEVSAFFTDLHRANGVAIETGCAISRILGDRHCRGVETADGRTFAADLVLVAVGAVPNTDLAAEVGLAIDNGIATDAHGCTSDPAIYAAGDCTSFHSPRFGRRIRLESVQNAIDQAKAVAAAIVGKPIAYDPVPWFWSDQFDVKLQIAGLSQGYDETEVIGDPAAKTFSVVYSRGGTLLAVDSINHPRAHMLARRAIGKPRADYDGGD